MIILPLDGKGNRCVILFLFIFVQVAYVMSVLCVELKIVSPSYHNGGRHAATQFHLMRCVKGNFLGCYGYMFCWLD